MRISIKLYELVGTPACSSSKRGVVVRGPERRSLSRSGLGSLVLSSVNYGKAREVVGSPNGERAV